MYSPTHYYVRVSRAKTFTGRSLASCRPTRTPSCATPDHCWGDRKPRQDQGARGTLAASSATAGPPLGRMAHGALPGEEPTSRHNPASRSARRALPPGLPRAAPNVLRALAVDPPSQESWW